MKPCFLAKMESCKRRQDFLHRATKRENCQLSSSFLSLANHARLFSKEGQK